VSDLSEVRPAAALGLATAPVTGVADYVEILKPRVMSLVVFTGLVGLVLAPGHIHPLLAAVAVLCIAVGAGAAGAINMWYDRDIDAMMRRTRGRPLPAGRMMPGEALGFGIALGVGAVLVMGLAVNCAAAELLALTVGFYVLVYTIWLKRRTPQNIVVGGAAGAFPPMIGWAAATGDIGWGAIIVPDRRLRHRRGADVAGRRRSGRNQAPDAALHALAVAGQRGALAARHWRPVLWRRLALVERLIHRLGYPGQPRRHRSQCSPDVRLFAPLSLPHFHSVAS
jgi:hypothetical protein